MRWDMLNCLAFCSTCHRWQTENPLAFNDWFEKKWLGRKKILQQQYNKSKKMTIQDYLKINEELEEMLHTLETLPEE